MDEKKRGKKHLNDKFRNIIKHNYKVMTGFQIAKALKVPEYVVYDYINYIKRCNEEKRITMDEKQELSSLIKFQMVYNGCMSESLRFRIEYLKSKIKNKIT